MRSVQAVFHSATLHKPHVATRSRQDFVDTNISSTLNLLEEAVTTRVESFVYTTTTNVLVTFLCRQRELRQHGSRRRLRLFPTFRPEDLADLTS
jgi:nucleoside-diphosphate-sugar epimerase